MSAAGPLDGAAAIGPAPDAGEPRVPLLALANVFFWIGATSFGGGLTGWVHRGVVMRRGWISEAQFLSGMAIGQVLPGANITNLAIYIGQRLRGPLGAILALSALLAGPFFLTIAFFSFSAQLQAIPGFHAAMDGIAAAAVGIILRLGYMSARHACRGLVPALVALAVTSAIGILHWPLVPVVLVAAPLSVALTWPRKPRDA